jgi:hypothetical protein
MEKGREEIFGSPVTVGSTTVGEVGVASGEREAGGPSEFWEVSFIAPGA